MGKLKEYYHDEIVENARNRNKDASQLEKETLRIPKPNVTIKKKGM